MLLTKDLIDAHYVDPGIGASLVWTVLTILDQIQSSISGLSDARCTYGKWKSYSPDDCLEWWLGEELECLARSEAEKTSRRKQMKRWTKFCRQYTNQSDPWNEHNHCENEGRRRRQLQTNQ